jgi:hypothetical protein
MHNTKCVYGVNMCETFYEREAICVPLTRCTHLGNSSDREFAMLQQSWIHTRSSLIFIACATTLLAGAEPGNIPNRDGLKQAWLQAMYAMERNGSNGFTAQNAAQDLTLSFGLSETRLIHGDDALTLRLVGYGPASSSNSRKRRRFRALRTA